MGTSAILKTSQTNLQTIFPHWSFMLMMNAVQKNEMLQVKYASSEHISSCPATLLHEDPTAILTKIGNDALQTYLMITYYNWHSPQKIKTAMKSFIQLNIHIPQKNKVTPETNLTSFIPNRTLGFWDFRNLNSVTSKTIILRFYKQRIWTVFTNCFYQFLPNFLLIF